MEKADTDSDSDSDTDSEYKERVVTMLVCDHYESGHGYVPPNGMSKYISLILVYGP